MALSLRSYLLLFLRCCSTPFNPSTDFRRTRQTGNFRKGRMKEDGRRRKSNCETPRAGRTWCEKPKEKAKHDGIAFVSKPYKGPSIGCYITMTAMCIMCCATLACIFVALMPKAFKPDKAWREDRRDDWDDQEDFVIIPYQFATVDDQTNPLSQPERYWQYLPQFHSHYTSVCEPTGSTCNQEIWDNKDVSILIKLSLISKTAHSSQS